MDIDTKRKIDTARDILVGKVPDPKSQVEQITIALIYKFMDDMDKQGLELGGKAIFFTGEYEKYSWSKIFDPRVSGVELVNLYSEAIQKMNHNPNIPQLFREIFKNAYLPYRDPETLKMFLKVIGEFEYDHSERLGDAYEHLLSIMSSQGDAGQFRTPRHIIDFMVEVIDPQKTETILDPACGTAGFLIFSYNHILNQNRINGHINLSPEERVRLTENIVGYDISPDMVRIALVNMYLHEFQNPKIYEYDTLASEDKWSDYFDVILANPPFMSPRGGIRPHKRFSVQSKRSEVLFVDYIAEHLNPQGRGAVIVPEGIIFKSDVAYKKLRKNLIDNFLYAVVSLPAGVFNPYSGVKTSILFLNKTLSKKTDSILFIKINNDGFNLGAQRREIKENDLPLALEIMQKFRQAINENREIEFNTAEAKLVHTVKKEKITENGDYNLSGDRYKETVAYSGKWDFVELGDICIKKGEYGSGARKVPFNGKIRYIRITDIDEHGNLKEDEIVSPSIIEEKYFLTKGDLLFARSGSAGRCYLHKKDNGHYQFAGYLIRYKIDSEKAIPEYVFYLTKSKSYDSWIKTQSKVGTLNNINAKQFSSIRIPLPPLEIQEQIVAELESYQKIIDGARQIVENYKPTFKIDPSWEWIELDKITEIIAGQSPKGKYYNEKGIGLPFYQGKSEFTDIYIGNPKKWTSQIIKIAEKDDILISVRAPVGPVNISTQKICIGRGLAAIRPIKEKIKMFYLFNCLKNLENEIKGNSGSVFDSISISQIKMIKVPLPPLEIQEQVVSEIQNEQKIIDANKELIKIYEQKIKDKIADLWTE